MSDQGEDLSVRAAIATNTIEHFMDSGHTIRALVELRTLLDEAQFWKDPDQESPIRDAYLQSVQRFAELGINETELKITLRA